MTAADHFLTLTKHTGRRKVGRWVRRLYEQGECLLDLLYIGVGIYRRLMFKKSWTFVSIAFLLF